MSSWAKVGAKCCLRTSYTKLNPLYTGDVPVTDVVYEIRGLTSHEVIGGIGIALVGINSRSEIRGPFWPVADFRPVIERTQEQDVHAIKSMLRELPAESRLDRLLEALDQ